MFFFHPYSAPWVERVSYAELPIMPATIVITLVNGHKVAFSGWALIGTYLIR